VSAAHDARAEAYAAVVGRGEADGVGAAVEFLLLFVGFFGVGMTTKVSSLGSSTSSLLLLLLWSSSAPTPGSMSGSAWLGWVDMEMGSEGVVFGGNLGMGWVTVGFVVGDVGAGGPATDIVSSSLSESASIAASSRA